MITTSHRRSSTAPLPYWLCMAFWLLSGPLGAGAAASGRWGRACLEAGLTLAGFWLLGDAMRLIQSSGIWALSDAIASGILSQDRLYAGSFALCAALALWGSDYWRMKSWHGRRADPLLDPTTLE